MEARLQMIPLNLPSDFVLKVVTMITGILFLTLPFGLAYVGLLIYAWKLRPAERTSLWAHRPHPVFLWGFLLLLLFSGIAWPVFHARIDPCDSEEAKNPRFAPKHIEIFRAPILHPGEPIRPEPRPGEPTAIYICMSYDLPDSE